MDPFEGATYSLVHQTDYRIRYQSSLVVNSEYAERLRSILSSLPFVSNVRINPAAQSLVVEYAAPASRTAIQNQIESCIQLSLTSDSLQPALIELTKEQTQINSVTHTVGYEVVHQNAQRIRVRIPRLESDSEYGLKLKYLAESLINVETVRINPVAKSLVVEFDLTAGKDAIAAARQKLFNVIQQASIVDLNTLVATPTKKEAIEPDYVERLGLPALGLILGLGALLELPFPGLVTGGILFTAAVPVFQRAIDGIRYERQLTIDLLDGLAISLHTLQGTFFPAAFMLGLIEGGEVIRDMTARSSERASLNLLDSLGTEALVERDGKEVKIPIKEVVKGDRVIVYPGDQIPVDGYILDGTGLIDQCKLTGESIPVTRTRGDEVFASTLLVDGQLCILTERTGNTTRAGVIVSLMQSAPVHDTRVENYATIIANQAVVPTLLTAAAVGIFSNDLNRCISLLTLDLGTGIRISVPTTILSALTYAARNGVFIRSGRAIEMLAKVDTVVFDKTGTLTQGHAGITDIKLLVPEVSELELLAIAATAEQGLTHPVADAIVRYAKTKGVLLDNCEAWDYRVGLGIVAQISGKSVLVGSHRLMLLEDICLDTLNSQYPDIKVGSNSLVYVAINGELAGVILYSDPLRPESKGVIQELSRQGISTYMLSGDTTRVAKSVADELGMNPDQVHAEAFPERKVEVVRALHDRGQTVAFCGDGINDSAALAYADVSISFAGATDIARETADVVLMENDLRSLIHAIKIARQAMEIIEQNVALVALPNISAVIAGVFFALDPVLAIVINNGSAILAEFNGLRPLLGPGGLTPLKQSVELEKLVEAVTPVEREKGKGERERVALELDKLVENDTQSLPRLMTQQELAKRLGSTSQTLSRRKLKAEFTEWSRNKDPDGIAWKFHSASKLFHQSGKQVLA